MTANHEHTPLDDLVLRMHIRFGAANTMGDDYSADDFANVIRILESLPAKIAAAEQRGAAKALRDAADYLAENRQLVIDGDEYIACNSCTVIHYDYLTYRADQEDQ
jgi:hypothetical protein